MTEKQLFDLKKQVDTANSTVSELKGQQTALLKQLKDDWGCKTIDEAEQKLKTLNAEIDMIAEQIEKGTTELVEKYAL